MPKVSVIIPVYNTEKYLNECLDSVCLQTLSDIEIICINDKSTDNSPEIIKDYAQKDLRIKFVDLFENGGVSKARNIGISLAKGEYIGFMDSDDFIEPEFYEKLYNKAVQTNADSVKGNIYYYYPESGKSELPEFYDINKKIKKNKVNFLYGFTSGIYKTNLVKENEICFPEGITHFEDPYFSIKAAILLNKVETVDDAKYFYVKHKNSACSNSTTYEKTLDFTHSVKSILKIINQYDMQEENYLICINFLFEQLIAWCSNTALEDRSNIAALDCIFDIMGMVKCDKRDIFKYYFLNLKQKEINRQKEEKLRLIAQLRKNIRAKSKV